MKFEYKAKNQGGELQVGFVTAASRNEAESILSGNGLFILLLTEVKEQVWYSRILDYFNRVKSRDLMVFTRQFATLLEAKISLDDALQTLKKQTKNAVLKETVDAVAIDVEAGLSLSQAFSKHESVFSSFYVNMVRSAEITGRVEEAVGFLADYIEKQAGLVARVRNALIYPAVMMLLFFVVGGIMIVVVFPQIGPIFEEAGVELPIFTRILLAGGGFMADWWWLLLVGILLGMAVMYDYLKTDEGRVFRDEVVLRTPIVNKLLKQMYVARFAESLSVLLKGGIPIAQAIEITGQTIGSFAYRDALMDAANNVRQGEPFSHSLAQRTDLFEPIVGQMVAVGESTGRIDALLEKVSEFYSREVEGLVGSLVELIQPLLMVVIGVLVGGLFASILIPIYNLAQTF